jgi:hypothetical protein
MKLHAIQQKINLKSDLRIPSDFLNMLSEYLVEIKICLILLFQLILFIFNDAYSLIRPCDLKVNWPNEGRDSCVASCNHNYI